ncbi:hypothetical protein AMTR_s00053p00206200 [Amborella trichopoda]|uniref:G-patch domain-containing protein n=1 Tax=Amborella trichopoda TaxID=13333 RepID=W1PDP9_AMBTC|nr:hypothetical protein AMTR_s00053p00206200 [Amborella trichopoda]
MLLAQGYCHDFGIGKNGQGVAEAITQSPHTKVDTNDRRGLGCTLCKHQCKLKSSRHLGFILGGIHGLDHRKTESLPKLKIIIEIALEELLERQLFRLILGAHIVATSSSAPKHTMAVTESWSITPLSIESIKGIQRHFQFPVSGTG